MVVVALVELKVVMDFHLVRVYQHCDEVQKVKDDRDLHVA
jgi:hypothetical protein